LYQDKRQGGTRHLYQDKVSLEDEGCVSMEVRPGARLVEVSHETEGEPMSVAQRCLHTWGGTAATNRWKEYTFKARPSTSSLLRPSMAGSPA